MLKIRKTFSVFRKNYQNIPLEELGSDPYKVLVSTVLSARTRDEATLKAAKKLFSVAPNPMLLNKLKTDQIRELIRGIGLDRSKAKHLKDIAGILVGKYKGIVPDNIEELISLPGVGRKTANLVLNRAYNIPAIAVDTHVHKISNLLKWVKTKDPEKTEKELLKLLPPIYWNDVNRLFVSIGRQFNTKKKLEEFLRKNRLIV